MYNEWSLKVFYDDIKDPRIEKDIAELAEAIDTYKQAIALLGIEEPGASLRRIIELKIKMSPLSGRLSVYFSLRRAANSADKEGTPYRTRVQALLSQTAKEGAIFSKYVAGLENLDEIIESDELLKEHSFYLKDIKRSADHTMSNESEALFTKLNLSGGSAWMDFNVFTKSNSEGVMNGEKKSLSELISLCKSDSREVRRAAYEAEMECHEKIKDQLAFALNSIKAQVITEAEFRGYKDVLDMTLQRARMKRETLDAMLSAIRGSFPKFREYISHKAKLFGHKNGMPWYDLGGVISGGSEKSYTVEEAHRYIVEHFDKFDHSMAEMADRAFKEEWIDFYPRKGKRSGAFCHNLPFFKQSRIMMNFSGGQSSLITLAHELGHAYHGQQICNNSPLNMGYTLPVAETASTFNELMVMNDEIANAEGVDKMVLIDRQLRDIVFIIPDMYTRYKFEDEVIRRRKDTFLYANDLEQIMLDAQKEVYGDSVDNSCMHKFIWCNKPHYYSSGRSYYNYPYSFGGLFARGLYAKYLEEGEAFVPKYREMLKRTPTETVEDAALILGIDLTDPSFWENGLKTIYDSIDEFIKNTPIES